MKKKTSILSENMQTAYLVRVKERGKEVLFFHQFIDTCEHLEKNLDQLFPKPDYTYEVKEIGKFIPLEVYLNEKVLKPRKNS